MRHRTASRFAIAASVAVGVALATACAGLFETALRLDAPPHRLAAADAVLTAPEHTTLAAADGAAAQSVALTARPLLPDTLAARTSTLPGVSRAWSAGRAVAVTGSGDLAARLRDRFPDLSVLTGDDRGRAEADGVAASRLKLILLASVSGGMVLIVMGILVGSIVGLSVEQRRDELALLRTIGATRRQIRKMVVRQTLRPALLGAVLGAAAAPLLGAALFHRLQDGGVVPSVLALRQGAIPIAAGILPALAVVWAAAAPASHRRGRPDEIGAAEIGRARRGLAWLAGAGALSCAVTTLAMPPANAAATGGGVALAGALGCALLGPRLVDRGAARLRPRGVAGELALTNVRARARRSAMLLTPVVLVAAIALGNVYQVTTQAHALRDEHDDVVRAVGGTVAGSGWIEHPAEGSHRIDPWALVGGIRVAAGTVAVPDGVADVGDTLVMALGDGARARVRVASHLDAEGTIALPATLVAAHGGTPADDYDTGLEVDAWITLAVVGVIVAYAAMSLVNTLVAALAGRRPELALLHMAGATRRQIRRMLAAEALAIAGIGAGAGTTVAAAGVLPLAIAVAGSPLPSGPLWVLPAVLAVSAALVLVPTFLTYEVSHAEAL
jgi:putative ABC transport system permease protein